MELSVGLLALALVVSALCAFTHIIVRSLKAQNELRASGGTNVKSETVEVDSLAAEYLFEKKSFHIKEKVALPSTLILP